MQSAPPPPAPPPPSYVVRRAHASPELGGAPVGALWDAVEWTAPFVHIAPSAAPVPRTRVKMLYDDENLYVAARLDEEHVWGALTENNSVVFMDNDFEVFLDPDGDAANYYELEINALSTTWQLSLDKPYAHGGTARSPHELPGLKAAVHVDGKLNDPTVRDTAWSVTIAIPFADLQQFGARAPPAKGDVWRVNFSRVQWDFNIVDGKYVRVPPHGTPLPQGPDQLHPEHNFVWSSTGRIDIHIPQRWGYVYFE